MKISYKPLVASPCQLVSEREDMQIDKMLNNISGLKLQDYVFESITDRQKSYLLELIQRNIVDDDEREQLERQMDGLSRDEALDAIKTFEE